MDFLVFSLTWQENLLGVWVALVTTAIWMLHYIILILNYEPTILKCIWCFGTSGFHGFCTSDFKMDWYPLLSKGNSFLTFSHLTAPLAVGTIFFNCNSKCESVSSALAVEYRVSNVVQLWAVGTRLAVPSPVFRLEHSSPHNTLSFLVLNFIGFWFLNKATFSLCNMRAPLCLSIDRGEIYSFR